MNVGHREARAASWARFWRDGLLGIVELGLMTALILMIRVGLENVPAFRAFEARHTFLADVLPLWTVCAFFLFFFRRKARLAELASSREALARGRVRRMSLPARWAILLIALGLVVAGAVIDAPMRTALLIAGVPMLLLFGAEELNIVLRPGNFVVPDTRNELLAFFKSRAVQVGYAVAIVSLAGGYILSLFKPEYIRIVLPICLIVSLLVPTLVFSRLDQQGGPNE